MDIAAPMSGSLFELNVEVGDRVTAGQELLIIESMKMEIPLESPIAGTVAEILAAPLQAISEGDILMRIESA